ncbi:MAG TPA: hypothetical protein VF045_07550, partial [Acidimicrobiales bacterium]
MRRVVAPAALVALAVLGSLAPVTAGAQGQSPAPPPSRKMALTFQSPSVAPGTDFLLRLRVERSVPPSAELHVTVFRAVQTRSEFAQTLDDRIARPIAAAAPPMAVGSLPADPNGEVTVRVPVELGTADGVFPVRVELRDRGAGAPLERFVTHLTYLTGSHSGPELALAMVLPVRAPISLPSDGPRNMSGLDELAASIAALDSFRSLPFALEPSPETVAALAATDDDRAQRAVESLRRLADEHPVVAGPFVPVGIQALVAAGLAEEVGAQLTHGRQVLA